jgi:hypothetical protein
MSHISHDKKAKMREKTKITTKRFRDSMSSDEKVKMREKETNGRKRLRLAKNDLPTFERMKEAKKHLHRTQDPENAHKHNSLHVSFAIDLLLNRNYSLSVKG